MIEKSIKNLSEIIDSCKEEIEDNNENVSAVLDLEDLKSLKEVINYTKQISEKRASKI